MASQIVLEDSASLRLYIRQAPEASTHHRQWGPRWARVEDGSLVRGEVQKDTRPLMADGEGNEALSAGIMYGLPS